MDQWIRNMPEFQSFENYIKMINAEVPKFELVGWKNLERSYRLDQFFRTLYSLSVKVWMNHFSDANFIFVPFKRYMKDNDVRQLLAKDISRRTNISLNYDEIQMAEAKKITHNNTYTPVNFNDRIFDSIRQYFDKDLEQLSKLIARSLKKGGTLLGFSGSVDYVNVKEYLAENW